MARRPGPRPGLLSLKTVLSALAAGPWLTLGVGPRGVRSDGAEKPARSFELSPAGSRLAELPALTALHKRNGPIPLCSVARLTRRNGRTGKLTPGKLYSGDTLPSSRSPWTPALPCLGFPTRGRRRARAQQSTVLTFGALCRCRGRGSCPFRAKALSWWKASVFPERTY